MTNSRYDQLHSSIPGAPSKDKSADIRTYHTARIVVSDVASGKSVTSLIWPTPSEESPEDIHNITAWRQCNEIWRPFAEAVLVLHSSVSSRTRRAIIGELNSGWWRFLIESDRSGITLDQISNSLFGEFSSWLQSDHGENVTWSAATCRKRYGRPLAIVKHLQSLKKLKPFFIACGLWRGTYKNFEPTKVIPRPAFSAMLSSAVKNIKETMQNRQRAVEMIESNRATAIRIVERGEYRRGEYSSLATILAVLDYRYKGVFPPIDQIKNDDRTLWDAIATRHGGLRKLEVYFYPTISSLIPFIIWLLATLAANPETLFETELDDYRVEEVLGTKRFVWRKWKKRAQKKVIRSFALSDDMLHPMHILEFLDAWSKRIRPLAIRSHRNMVFLTVSRVHPRQTGITLVARAPRIIRSRGTISNALSKFLKTNNIGETIHLRQIRTSVLDIADEISGGDIRAVAALGNHASIDTANRHYTSDGARSRDNQSLALVQNARERWLHSGGVVDNRGEPSNADKLSATPGWMCLDPFDSPMPSSKEGELCNAYGRCPSCPHAAIDTTSPYALARLIQLRDIIRDAATRVSPERWLAVWKPCLESIDTHWLKFFRTGHTLEAADKLNLPALPDVD